jgi:hypothetical protein
MIGGANRALTFGRQRYLRRVHGTVRIHARESGGGADRRCRSPCAAPGRPRWSLRWLPSADVVSARSAKGSQARGTDRSPARRGLPADRTGEGPWSLPEHDLRRSGIYAEFFPQIEIFLAPRSNPGLADQAAFVRAQPPDFAGLITRARASRLSRESSPNGFTAEAQRTPRDPRVRALISFPACHIPKPCWSV